MDDGYNPIKAEIESLKQQLKEKDSHIQEEVLYKKNERARVETLEQQLKERDKEIETINKQLKLSFNAFNQFEDKILNIAKEILAVYGKTITDQKKQ